jgi:hypothetical protein
VECVLGGGVTEGKGGEWGCWVPVDCSSICGVCVSVNGWNGDRDRKETYQRPHAHL